MQRADIVLTMLNQKAKSNCTHKFRRLYRNLFNPDFYLNAYAKIYSKEGNMTKGVDGKTIDGFGLQKIKHTVAKLKYERYNPQPAKRKYIPKKNGKMRPLGIPSTEDKLVQEIIRQILEAIYEPIFSSNSHGFRPNRSCHTALYQIKKTCNGCSWIIEGDIKGFFDNIDHDVLLEILSRKIEDGRFINLIKKFLKSGVMEEGKIKNPITGTPQGGIISPILANIYLNELDQFMEQMKTDTEQGKRRNYNKQYRKLLYLRGYQLKKGNKIKADEILKMIRKTPSIDTADICFKRIKYVRYADDFLILIHGSKSLAMEIKLKVTKMLTEKLHLELNTEKTLITNPLSAKVRFLGYEITKAKNDSMITTTKKGIKRRCINGSIQLLLPADIINEKIRKFTRNGKPAHITDRCNLSILEILIMYNAEIRGLYNYYCLAHNVGKRLNRYGYYHYYSMVKTLAHKHKMSTSKTIRKFGVAIQRRQGTGTWNIIGTRYQTKNGEKTLTYFNQPLKKKDNPLSLIAIPDDYKKKYKNELIQRLSKGQCELCNRDEHIEELEVHHIRNLKNTKKRYQNKKEEEPDWLKLMTKIRRKTLITCKACHKKIHKRKI